MFLLHTCASISVNVIFCIYQESLIHAKKKMKMQESLCLVVSVSLNLPIMLHLDCISRCVGHYFNEMVCDISHSSFVFPLHSPKGLYVIATHCMYIVTVVT